MTDKLTGLKNLTFVREQAQALLAGPHPTMIMVKPDNFKHVNDTYGNDAGDETLRRLADTVRSVAEGEICVRYKGDVFCFFVSKPHAEDSRRKASRSGTRNRHREDCR